MPQGNPDFDYIVIGSGAGGGPVACRLAENGYKVGLARNESLPAALHFDTGINRLGFRMNEAPVVKRMIDQLGYAPQSRSEDYADKVLAAEPKEGKHPVAEHYQGGPVCSVEYSADFEKISKSE